MPVTFYTQEKYQRLQRACTQLSDQVQAMEQLRPHWGVSAQVTAASLSQLWLLLGATDQTQAVTKLRALLEA